MFKYLQIYIYISEHVYNGKPFYIRILRKRKKKKFYLPKIAEANWFLIRKRLRKHKIFNFR